MRSVAKWEVASIVKANILLLSLVFFNGATVFAQVRPEHVSFQWTLAVQVESEGKNSFAPLLRDTTLRKGSKLKLFIRLESESFVYVFRDAGKGNMELLFPKSIERRDYKRGQDYFIPASNSFLEIGKTDTMETFYLLASSTRLVALEEVMLRYLQGNSDKEGHNSVVSEISKLRREYVSLSKPAERPISIAGTVRGIDDVARLAMKVEAEKLFLKSIRITTR
jgi:hypothetical protein